ncbi:1314_t:CDS:2 [Ambispora gerdemannii]|uniref:Translocation protein SEC62 n=1 Tax=Ambispora gerdemannii TaxID=144530 RepID=A0A9N9BTG7_9GLOM|nr:1314_t:CDS:2 [Ambispora gerdemannii]
MEAHAEAPPDILNVVKYLRSSASGIKLRGGVHNGKRVEYFKGKSAVKALLKDSYTKAKNVPKVASSEEAAKLLKDILPYALFLRVERSNSDSSQRNAPKILTICPAQMFAEDQYYVWLYEGSQLWTILGGIALIAVVFAGVMFPLWPAILRDTVWYLAVAVLALFGILVIISVIRLILFIITMLILPRGIWIFPNLFEDVGFVDSFIPLWAWDVPKKKEKIIDDEDDDNNNSKENRIIGSSNSRNNDTENRNLQTTVQDAEEDNVIACDEKPEDD